MSALLDQVRKRIRAADLALGHAGDPPAAALRHAADRF